MDRKTNTNSVFVFIFGFVFSVLASSFVFVAPLVGVFILTIGLALLVAEGIWNRGISKNVLFLSLVLISFGLGALRYAIKDFHEPLAPASQGIVVNEPEQRDNSTRFVFRADNGEKVLVNTDLYSTVQYGDRVRVVGKPEKPGVIDDEDGGRPFDYGKYLSKDDIYFTMSFTEVAVLSGDHGNPIRQILFKLKKSFIKKTQAILAEPYASLLSGLIVSGKEAMPKDILAEFRRAGIIHIVVLSGYNITIIAEFIRKMLENFFLAVRIRVTPRLVATTSILGIILFVLMTGAEATVVRAALMVLVVIAAKLFGRTYSAPRALLVAAFLMILHNPKILVFDPSFQLSFLATCALIYIVPIVEKYLKFIPEKWGLRMTVTTTLATQLTVLPLLVYSMGDFSLVSLPANILVLPIIPITMLVGFMATLTAYASSILAWPFSYVVHTLLVWILGVASIFSNLSFASVTVPSVSIWWVGLIYSMTVIFLWRWRSFVPHSAN